METRYAPVAPVEEATPAPVSPAVVLPWAPTPMEPTRYSRKLPPDLLTRPAAVTQQLALLMAAHQYTLPAPAPTAPPVDTRISGRAKGAALVALAGGTGVGGAATGIGYGTGMIAANSHGLMTAALALAITTGSIGALTFLARSVFGRRSQAQNSGGDTYITQNVTATGLFGRANGTVNHTR